jgi:hypothetical protein
VSNFENVGSFYAIERMRGMRVGETMGRQISRATEVKIAYLKNIDSSYLYSGQ